MLAASHRPQDEPTSSLGYLTYVDLPALGMVGGLLVVDLRARPVEFHCSSPVQPTRTQEILYGQTLRSSIVCEIGTSLVEHTKQRPPLLITDDTLVLELQPHVSLPIVVCSAPKGPESSEVSIGTNESGTYRLQTANDDRFDDRQIHAAWSARVGSWDGLEPLDRIREAIAEAHRAAA